MATKRLKLHFYFIDAYKLYKQGCGKNLKIRYKVSEAEEEKNMIENLAKLENLHNQ